MKDPQFAHFLARLSEFSQGAIILKHQAEIFAAYAQGETVIKTAWLINELEGR